MEIMNDITFVNNHCELIGEQYEEAKNLYRDAPIQTLVILRSLIANLCDTISSELCLDVEIKDVYDLIQSIKATKKLDRKIISKLHDIRIAGNKAAHKETYHLEKEEFIALALKTLQDFCDLINLIRSSFQRIITPDYNFDAQIQSSMQDLSYKALFDNEPNAKYVVGCALAQMHYKRLDDFANPETNKGRYVLENEGQLKRGVDLIESAAIDDDHLESLYEYAAILISGTERDKDINKGIEYFRRAGFKGHINSKAYHGYYVINRPSSLDFEIEEAIENLEIAASHNHPTALDTLSVLYQEGKHLNKDINKSVEYLEKAAVAGYPESQYKLANYYYSKCKDHEAYIFYMTEAANNRYPAAYLSLARTHSQKASTEEAVKAYKEYLVLKPDPIAEFELGHLILSLQNNCVDSIKTALTHFINSYRSDDCPNNIAKQIEVASKKGLNLIAIELRKQHLSREETNNFTKFFMQFDSNSRPFKSTEDMAEAINSIFNDRDNAHKYVYLPTPAESPSIVEKIGRNDICPHCSSGKKYKKCCGK
ncbi:sel1 repeat family protein [Shewanella abyssi]|uniref:tetratricopeptide repeat protein n=1 Tax=Shewanella abyssi TaxID=311789 RepID=UPI0020101C6D|nr:tetratricopeptide repeat protein [Shewanella abyssi]MCL1052219.1 sel1 repeat family protein [Shewanella abyssi]